MDRPRDVSILRTEGAKIALPLFACIVVGSALALGSEHTPELVGVAIGVAVCAAATWRGDAPVRLRHGAKLLVCLAAGLAAYTLVQVVPLPVGVLARIAPHSADVWARSRSAFGEAGPSWATISVDPVATRVQVLRGAVYLVAFLTAVRLASRRQGATLLAAALMAGGVLMAASAVGHAALETRRVFGVYDLGPTIDLRHVAPLPNPNHLGGYLNIAFSIALASAVAKEPRIPRVASLATVALLVAAQFWVASRGAVVTMIGAAILVVWATRAARQGERRTLVSNIAAGSLIALSIAVFVLGASRVATTELTDSDVSKLALARLMAPVVPPYAWLGAGRGAFESAFAEFRTGVYHVVYTNPEDVVLQWASEWGVPVSIAAFVTLAVALRPRAVLARSDIAGGAWVALVASGFQNLVDYSSEIPGVVLALVVCAAIVLGGSAGRAPAGRFDRWSLAPKAVAIGGPVLLLGAIALVLPGLGHELREDRATLRALALAPATSAVEMRQAARAAIARHPAEPYYAYAAALRAELRGDDNVMPWIEYVLERATVYGPAHLVLSRFLSRRAPAQARLELRLAVEQDPELASLAARDAPRLVGGYDDALEIVPRGADGAEILEIIGASVANRLPATAERLDESLAARTPPRPVALFRLAERAIADLGEPSEAPWCDEPAARDACVARALSRARAVQAAAPKACAGYRLEAAARLANGESSAPLEWLRDAATRVDDRPRCLRELAEMAVVAHAAASAEAAVDDLARAGCDDSAECGQDLAFGANIALRLGSVHRALALLRRAQESAPDDDAIVAQAAGLASGADLHAEALHDYETLARRHPDEPKWRDAAAKERATILRAPPR